VQAAALNGINQLSPSEALSIAKTFEKEDNDALTRSVISVYADNGKSEQWPFVYKQFTDGGVREKLALMRKFAQMAGSVDNPAYAQQGIGAIKDFGIKYKGAINDLAPFVVGLLNDIKGQRTELKDDASAKVADEAVKAVNEAK
jgi:aminopeptidase N